MRRELGQHFTKSNVFDNIRFKQWFSHIPLNKRQTIIEPFAGNCDIIKHVEELYGSQQWALFDVEPKSGDTTKQDTIASFPNGYYTCITNPPYLAKNSATRRHIVFPEQYKHHDDLYKVALQKMLEACEYVAVIIPESFITSTFVKTRLVAVISLTDANIFEQTDCPVCLALFEPRQQTDFEIWRKNELLTTYSKIKDFLTRYDTEFNAKLIFNNPNGELGIWAIDSSIKPTIRFILGADINPDKIKVSSRSYTRIKLPFEVSQDELLSLIKVANEELAQLRDNTQDIVLTAFKGLRKDNMYRRRLDWKTAKRIILHVLKTKNYLMKG